MFEVAIALATVITKTVERIRQAFEIDGWQVTLLAVALGVAAVFGGEGVLEQLGALDLDGVFEKIALGFVSGAGAGILADVTGRSGPFA